MALQRKKQIIHVYSGSLFISMIVYILTEVKVCANFNTHNGLNFSPSTPDYYNYDNYSPEEIFKLGTDYCNDKSTCSDAMFLTFPEKICHCDKLCGLLSDCCRNYAYESISYLTKDQFECVSLPEIVLNREYGVSMVTKCVSEWKHNFTRELCEGQADESDILLRLPVSDTSEFHVMFKNMYCAQCNFVQDFFFWKQEIKCRNETGVRSLPEMKDCVSHFIRPVPKVSYRTCQFSQSIISYCNQSAELSSYNVIKDCTDGIYAVTFDNAGLMYRNKYCAVCNGVSENTLYCVQQNVLEQIIDEDARNTYSLRLIVDFNTGEADINGKREQRQKCKDNEIYDSFSQKCREIHCAPPFVPINGVCNKTGVYPMTEIERAQPVFKENCTWVKVDTHESEFTNNSELFLRSHKKVYESEEYFMNATYVIVCVAKTNNCVNNCDSSKRIYYPDIVESYLTLFGLIVSILSLVVTLAVYVSFPQLLNIPGKILASLIISLLLAQILFLSAPEVRNNSSVCILFAILVHYFFLAAFFWMNVIAFDLWKTFSNRCMTGFDRKGRTRFIRYAIYAWLCPVLIVCVAVILDFVNIDEKFLNLKPGYGNGVCWISSRDALILFFVGPLAVFKIFNIISFVSTAVHIARSRKEGAIASRLRNTRSLIINLKLSLIMGLTWVFAFLANSVNESYMWYLFIIFNSLQGFFIAICYLCTKKVGRLMSEKYKEVTTRCTLSTLINPIK